VRQRERKGVGERKEGDSESRGERKREEVEAEWEEREGETVSRGVRSGRRETVREGRVGQ